MIKRITLLVFFILMGTLIPTISADEIIIENADTIWTNSTYHSSDMENTTQSVTPRIIAIYANILLHKLLGRSSTLDSLATGVTPRISLIYANLLLWRYLSRSSNLDALAAGVTPRINTIYANLILKRALANSESLNSVVASASARINAQYANMIFNDDLIEPDFSQQIPRPPVANPGGPYNGEVNQQIQFQGSAYGGIPPYTYEWDFNRDGTIDSTLQNPTRTWATAGTYYPSLRIRDSNQEKSKLKECVVYISEPYESFSFVHMTDIHMGTYREIGEWVWGWPPKKIKRILTADEILSKAVEKIKELKSDLVLVTGDIADQADEPLYRDYQTIMNRLHDSNNYIDYYSVPGNHDRYYTPIGPFDPVLIGYYTKILGYPNYFQYKGFYFFGLDSGGTIETDGISGSAISSTQKKTLESLPSDIPKIIFMHHPVFDKLRFGDWRIQNDRGWFIEDKTSPYNYCENSNIALVLSGHTHDKLIYDKNGNQYNGNWNEQNWPLFIQTPSLTKNDQLQDCAFREIKITGRNIEHNYYYPYRENLQIKWVLNSPATLHAYDSLGRHTGINLSTGEIEQSIPRTYYLKGFTNENNNETAHPTIISYNLSEDYLIKIIANLTEEQLQSPEIEYFNFTVEKQTNNSLTILAYTNVSLFENTTALLLSNVSTTDYTMNVDYNGDNVTDEEKDPDFVITDYAPTVVILVPENNSTFVLGEEIQFTGSANDTEDGLLTSSAFTWTSNINGYIGGGNIVHTTNLSTGNHLIELTVNDSIGQTVTKNVTITIISPDLFINTSALSFSNLNPLEGHTIVINATISNQGTTPASNIIIRFYNGNPQNGTQINGDKYIGSLNPGAHALVSTSWNTLNCAGDNDIWVSIDPDNSIIESSEQNNQANKNIFVRAPDQLHITELSADQPEYLEGQNVMITCIVENATGNVSGVNVSASIKKPDETTGSLMLIEWGIGVYQGIFSDTQLPGIYIITCTASRPGFQSDTETSSFKILDSYPPKSISNLSNTSGPTWITWTWTNPTDLDFNHAIIYCNGVWTATAVEEQFTMENLSPNTLVSIGILTVDDSGNINETWVNQTTIMEQNLPPTIIGGPTPGNGSTGIQRPPSSLSVTVGDQNSNLMDIIIRWKNHNNQWINLQIYTDIGNGTYNFIPFGNNWIWGNTTYIWSVNVTDGNSWTNRTYHYTTKGNRYDVNNNNMVNFQDAGLVWTHRTSLVPYDGLYDVNDNGQVNFQDAGLTWTHRG